MWDRALFTLCGVFVMSLRFSNTSVDGDKYQCCHLSLRVWAGKMKNLLLRSLKITCYWSVLADKYTAFRSETSASEVSNILKSYKFRRRVSNRTSTILD